MAVSISHWGFVLIRNTLGNIDWVGEVDFDDVILARDLAVELHDVS